MRRAFLLSFVPAALLLTGSFWSLQKQVELTVRNGLRDSLRASDLQSFTTPAVFLREGKVMISTVPGVKPAALERALNACPSGECSVRLAGQSWISSPAHAYGSGYTLRFLQNVDAAGAPVRHLLQRVFLCAAGLAFVAALLFSARLAKHPKPRNIPHDILPVREINELTSSVNQAEGAVQDARGNLQRAYVGFVGSLASALDARDRYTAGHSRRVSDLSCATALALGITGERLEEVRIGALLHDIGKVGVPDAVLQKPGKLSAAESAILRTHPQIGRRILEGVTGFAPYLDSVELHHENWDGTGYPWGQRGLETPIAARIIHVADAYDAMTTNRPYRPGMRSEEAVSILRRCAGTQFDPLVVEAFAALCSTSDVDATSVALVAAAGQSHELSRKPEQTRLKAACT